MFYVQNMRKLKIEKILIFCMNLKQARVFFGGVRGGVQKNKQIQPISKKNYIQVPRKKHISKNKHLSSNHPCFHSFSPTKVLHTNVPPIHTHKIPAYQCTTHSHPQNLNGLTQHNSFEASLAKAGPTISFCCVSI